MPLFDFISPFSRRPRVSTIPTADTTFGFTGPEGRRSTRIERPVPLLITGHDGLGQEFLEDSQWDDAVQLFPNLLIDCAGLATNKVMQDYLRARPLPRRFCGKLFSARLRQLRAGQRSVGETFTDDALERERKTHRVISFAVVETERLFVKVTEQMKRFDRHIGALDGTLEQRDAARVRPERDGLRLISREAVARH